MKDDLVTLKKTVSLVAGQEEIETEWEELDCVPLGHFVVVVEGSVIWPDQLPQAEESMETNDKLCEKQVVMGSREVGIMQGT